MTLAILATEENWQGFDDAWTALIGSEGPLDELLTALDVVSTKRRMARCMTILRVHVDNLAGGNRPAEAAQLLGAALRGGGPVNEIAEPLVKHAELAWGSEEWWLPFRELADFHSGTPDLRRAWMYFDDMRSYQPGIVIFHAAGWGTGEVLDVSVDALDIGVRFQSGRKDRFPLRTAVEIFERLPETDLRSQHLRGPDELKKRIKKEPLEILRSVLLRYGGKASTVTLRNALMQIGVDGPSWTNWWRKARVAAENSEWFRVSGNASRAEVELLRRAMNPVDALNRQLKHAVNLKTALSRVRDLFGGSAVDDTVRTAALDAVAEAANDPKEPLEQRLAAWMLLREHKKATPEVLLTRLREAAAKPRPEDPSVAPPLWVLLNRIPGAREQEQALDLMPELFGENWADAVVEDVAHAPAGMVQPLVTALLAAGKQKELGRQYALLLARPTRAPFALVALARAGEEGKLEGTLPTPVQRALALVELGVFLFEEKRGNTLHTRAHGRLVDLLTKGKPALLETLLADADVPALRSARLQLQRGVDDAIDSMVTDVALSKGVDLFKSESVPYWKEERIWTTRQGLARRERELRELREVKIPANAEAIARAASYGDLSENAEWEQAIEEQRQLTSAASLIERELRQAALLENATIPENTVCPGTFVRYKETANGSTHDALILGPWDNEPNTISYRAPLAAGMLGLHPGDRANIELPSGRLEIQVLEVKLAVEHV